MINFKVWMVALTALMGVTLTSCLNSDDDNTRSVYGIFHVKGVYPYQFQYEGDNIVYEANSTSIAGLENAYVGDLVLLSAEYDTSTQTIDQNTKKIIVSVLSTDLLNAKTETSNNNDVTYNRSVGKTSNLGVNYEPFFYGKYWMILNIGFYIEKKSMESALKHTFYVVWDKDHKSNTEDTIVLRLRHYSEETDKSEVVEASLTKAFSLYSIMAEFNKGGSNKIRTVKLITQEKEGTSNAISDDSEEGYTEHTYTIDYTKIVEP